MGQRGFEISVSGRMWISAGIVGIGDPFKRSLNPIKKRDLTKEKFF
jgi:hypothetical protein